MTSFDDCPYVQVEDRVNLLSLFYMPSVFGAVKIIQEWEECASISNILEKNLLVIGERIQEIFVNRDKQPYQVLVHGDFQFKNMISHTGGLKNEDFFLVWLINPFQYTKVK